MKILLLNDYATPTGGAELMTLALRDGLRQRGHDARLFAGDARAGGGDVQADYTCFGTTSRFRTLLQTANPSAAMRLRQTLAEFRPDVVHVRMFLTQLSPLILPLLRDVPSLYHVVWYRPICPIGTKLLPDGTPCQVSPGVVCYRNGCLPARDWAPLLFQLHLWRRWRAAFDLVVANSAAVGERLRAEGIAPVEVVWNGVPRRAARPPLAAPPTVAFAGRLVPEKGADLLVRAFARIVGQLPEARLILAGDGPEGAWLARLVADLGLDRAVTLTGHLDRAAIEARFATAWVQAVPSRWAEPFGIAAAEGAMRGTAIVASAGGGLSEIVRDGATGFLVPPGDVDALAAALRRLLGDRDLAERLGGAGREDALARFDEATFVERFIALYERIRQDRPHPSAAIRKTPTKDQHEQSE